MVLLLGCAMLVAQSTEGGKLAPYYPTPETIVEKMLQLGGLKAGEKMYDLGSGDGRIEMALRESLRFAGNRATRAAKRRDEEAHRSRPRAQVHEGDGPGTGLAEEPGIPVLISAGMPMLTGP